MAEDKKMQAQKMQAQKMQAQKMYQLLQKALDDRDWRYEKDDERLLVHFGVSGDDIPMKFIMAVDAERTVVRLMSLLPFEMDENKRVEGAIAACAVSNALAEGNFDYNLSKGELVYRQAMYYENCQISVDAVQYMISLSCAVVDRYNELFLALSKGYLSIGQFLEKL